MDIMVIVQGSTTPGVALKVNVEANDIVNPICWHIQEVARLENNLIALNFLKIRKFLGIGLLQSTSLCRPEGWPRGNMCIFSH